MIDIPTPGQTPAPAVPERVPPGWRPELSYACRVVLHAIDIWLSEAEQAKAERAAGAGREAD